jgi:hypothetical protein
MSNRIPSVETKVENSTNVEAYSVCPNNAKPLVVCSQSPPMLVIDGLEIFSGVKIDERLFALKIKTIELGSQ